MQQRSLGVQGGARGSSNRSRIVREDRGAAGPDCPVGPEEAREPRRRARASGPWTAARRALPRQEPLRAARARGGLRAPALGDGARPSAHGNAWREAQRLTGTQRNTHFNKSLKIGLG